MSVQTVGRYEIISELGRGAMGVVYKAKDPNIGRTVALKTMRLDVNGLETSEMVRRFKNEARAAGVLNHPNIVTIYDAGEDNGIFYIAMEFMEGTTLHELMAEKRILDPEEAIRLSREICKGLDYAHSHGIVHRDVKPANIMITTRGAVKIMDFGIAKSGGSMTSTGQVLGTPNYMAPEQVKGRSLDGRSDLFSFAVILYEMLTGEKPFVGQSVTTIIYKIVNESPIPPRDLDTTVHPGLSAIVVKALAKAPEDRYQSGAELVRDLENYKTGPATLAATMAIPATMAMPAAAPTRSQEKTVIMPMRVVAGSTVRAAETAVAPTRNPVPMPQPAVARSSRRTGLIVTMVMILLLGGAIGVYAYYRTHMQMQQLEAEIKADETQSAKSQAQAKLSPAASDQPTTTTATINADTTAKPAGNDKVADEKSSSSSKPKKPVVASIAQSALALTSQPDGAKVEVDGQSDPLWVTPFKAFNLTPGTHSFVFSKPGYLPETRTLESVAGKSSTLTVELFPASTVNVSSNPNGASIWVDGKDSGKITPAQVALSKGLHQIIVKKSGYEEAPWEGNLGQGQAASFSPVLLSLNQHADRGPGTNFLNRFFGTDSIPDGKGLVHIRTVPEGATIVVDGHVAPKKSNAKWPAAPGIYSIDLQMNGYKSIHRNIHVKLGKITPIDEIMEKQ